MTRDATDADDGDDAPAPHLGAAVLARIVAATFSPGYDPDDDCYFEVEKTRRNLRLCCRLLRDLVDEEKTRVTVEVDCDTAILDAPLHEDFAQVLGRFRNMSSVSIMMSNESESGFIEDEDEHARLAMMDAGVVRMLLVGLPRALPEGVMGRVAKLFLRPEGDAPLSPAIAAAICAATPRLQWLSCSLPTQDEWTGRLVGSAVLRDLPTSLQDLDLWGGDMGPDGGEALAGLAALTRLRFFSVRGVRNSVCGHVARLSGLRSLSLATSARDYHLVQATYDAADAGALSSLVHLTRLHMERPFMAEHLPLAHLTALLDLGCCVSDVEAFETTLAMPSLAQLRELQLELQPQPGGAPAAGGGGGAASTAASLAAPPAATATAAGPLLPALGVLKCKLPLCSPQQIRRLPRLLQRLPVGTLRKVDIGNAESLPADKPAIEEVIYLLTTALARFTAVESLQWELGSSGTRAPEPVTGDSPRLPLPPGGTFVDLVRAMPRLRKLDIKFSNEARAGGAPGAPQQQQGLQAPRPAPTGRAWLTDEALEALASQPDSRLEVCRLDNAVHVTLAGVQGLLRLPRLRHLSLFRCPLVPMDAKEALEQAFMQRSVKFVMLTW